MESATTENSSNSASDQQPSNADKEVKMRSPDHTQERGEETKNESSNHQAQGVESQTAWLTGIPLVMATIGVTLVTMLFMLDVAIVTTVNNTFITTIRSF